MRVVVIKNSRHKNDYTHGIYILLESIARSQGYAVVYANAIKDAPVSAAGSITFITCKPAPSIYTLIRQQQLNSFNKKNKTTLLIQNASFFIKQKKIPQLLITDDTDNIPATKQLSNAGISLLTYSATARQSMIDKGFTNTIHIVPAFAGEVFQPVNWSMKQQLKIDYTEGREYFYIPQSFKNMETLLNVLKAFSGFKKWQQSSMKLALAGKLYVPPDDWHEKRSTYKYREDVLECSHLPETEKAKLLAGAYACVLLPEKDNDILPLLQAMQCHTPIISFETKSVQDYAADAAITAVQNNYDALSKQMIVMYKDENMRNQLAENCAVQAVKYSKEQAAQALQNMLF